MAITKLTIRNDQNLMGRKKFCSKWKLALGWILIGIPLAGVQAGNVFMKNGYILQGPIVDQDEFMVVLGWQNGKVYLHRRFLESVVLDPEEEAAIARKKATKTAGQGAEGEPEAQVIGPDTGSVEDLPEDWRVVEDWLKKSGKKEGLNAGTPGDSVSEKVPPVEGANPNSTSPGGASLQPGSTTPPVDVSTVPSEVKGTGSRQEVTELGFSIEPPKGWSRESSGDEGVRWAGARQNDGFVPALVIVSAPVADWNLSEARKSILEDPKEILSGYQILKEEEKQLHGRTGYLFIAQGKIGLQSAGEEKGSGESAGNPKKDSSTATVSFKQFLVPGKTRFWLISAFSSETTAGDDLTAMERAVDSIQFLSE